MKGSYRDFPVNLTVYRILICDLIKSFRFVRKDDITAKLFQLTGWIPECCLFCTAWKKVAVYFNSEVHILGTSKWDGDDVKNKVKRYVEQSVELMEEADITCKSEMVFGGNIANATMDYADKVEADLIIAMSETEPAAGFFMGANAQRLVNRSEVPILTVHAKQLAIRVPGY